MSRIVSLLPAATEIAAALGLMDEVVGVSHECDFPNEANTRPRVTHCPVHNAGLASKEVDQWVRRALNEQARATRAVPASTLALRASMTLESSPPEAMFSNCRNGSPGFVEIM